MKLSLRWKFYLLVLPSVVILVALVAMLMVPHGEVQEDVGQINAGLAEVLSAEGFARHYERQFRECAAFVATGSAEHERLFEKARQQAGVDIGDWIKAEVRHTGDTPGEHAEELRTLDETKKAYNDVNSACDWVIALARSGQREQAIANLEDAENGPSGTIISRNIDEQLPEEEAQLNSYLDTLEGAVQSLSIMRLLGLGSTVESMKTHVASTILAERFARYYNKQVLETLAFSLIGKPRDQAETGEAREQATEALEQWGEEVALLQKESDRGRSIRLVDDLQVKYESINRASESAVVLASTGDSSGAIALMETETGPTQQSTLTAAIDKEVENEKKALQEDADRISSRSRNTAWGVGIVGSALLLLALGATLLVSRMVVVPVVKLRDAAREFGQSGREVDVDIKTRDELGELAISFNEMSVARASAEEELRTTRDELEDRVEERTGTLAALNEELLSQITEREEVEKALRGEQEFTRTIIDSLTDIFYVLSVEKGGLLVRWNRAFQEVSGYSDEELSGMTVFDFFDPEGQKAQEEFLIKLMGEGAAQIETEVIVRDGSRIPYYFGSTLVRDGQGNPEYVTGVGRDVTELKKASQALEESEGKFRFLAENMNDFAFIVDLNMQTVYASPSVEKVLGYSPAEQMQRPVQDILTSDSLEEVSKMLLEELAHDRERDPDRTVTVVADFYRKDGSVVFLETKVNLVRDEVGNPTGAYGLARDITERRKAEERLRITQFEVDSSLEEIVRVVSDGSVVYVNEAACRAHGYSREEMLALTLPEITLNFPSDEWTHTWEVLKEMQSLQLEIVGLKKDGETFPLEVTINFLEYDGQEYVVMFGRDITERKEAEEKRAMLNRELMAINKELNDFAYVVSHDLKAPLRGIGSLATWLASDYADVLDEEGRRQLELLLDRAKRMESLIESVLQYSRVGRVHESRETVDINRLIESAIEMVNAPANIKVSVEGKMPEVTGERTRLGQVFQNLIDNAVKFMDKPEGTVTISCNEDGDHWKFAVADNGPGVDPKYFDTIFGIFQTLGSRDDMDSTGVGLTLVKKIVEMHGGEVRVESEVGRGSTFFFTLPKAKGAYSEDNNGRSDEIG